MKNRMTKFFAIVLSVVMLFSAFVFTASAADPTVFFPDDKGVFHISTAGDLDKLATDRVAYGSYAGKTIVLDADIDLNPGWTASATAPDKVWTALWTMSGTIDGQGHTIKGVYIVASGDYAGSFIRNAQDLTLKNITFDNCYLGGGKGGTAIVSCLKGNNSFNGVTVGANVIIEGGVSSGALAGMVYSDGTNSFVNCECKASILVGGNCTGGILGDANGFAVTFDGCKFTGTMTGADVKFVGGILGNTATGVDIKDNCTSTGAMNITGDSKFDPICPKSDVTPSDTPKYTATVGWAANSDGVYEIGSPEDLLAFNGRRAALGNYKDAKVVLTADIDLNPGWDASTKETPVNPWLSIWTFEGEFDGQGHTISGIYGYNKDGSNSSFITIMKGATLKNVKFTNCAFVGVGSQAGLVACIRHESVIENVYCEAIVESGGSHVGGIVGWFFTSEDTTPKLTLKNVVFNGSVTGKSNVGGLVGTNTNGKTTSYVLEMIDCAAFGTVTALGTDPIPETIDDPAVPAVGLAGGLVGKCLGNLSATRCLAASKVAGLEGTVAGTVCLSQTVAAEILFNDVYYVAGIAPADHVHTTSMDGLKAYYGGVSDSAVKSLTAAADLLAIKEFKAEGDYKGWAQSSDKSLLGTVDLIELVNGHQYGAGVVTPPTCSERGYTTYTCVNCGATNVSDYQEMIPHTPTNEWIVDKAPSTEYAGSRHMICSVCKKTVQTEIIPRIKDEGDEQNTTEKTTEKATSASTEPTTSAGEEQTTGGETSSSSGCSGVVSLGSLALLSLIALGGVSLKKK